MGHYIKHKQLKCEILSGQDFFFKFRFISWFKYIIYKLFINRVCELDKRYWPSMHRIPHYAEYAMISFAIVCVVRCDGLIICLVFR